MEVTRLGRTGLSVTRTAFGALPIQRTDREEAARILRRAYDAGINFYDTARGYSDSEEKIGYALSSVRDRIIIATKSGATTKSGVLEHLDTSLRNLKTDYVDVFQLHNPKIVPDPNDPESSYAALMEAKRAGKVRFVGMTNHRLPVAREAVESDLFDTLQYPLCYLSNEEDLSIIEKCRAADLGLIGMKPFSGGILNNARAAFTFLRQFDNLVPIFGFQRMSELEEVLALDSDPPVLDGEILAVIEKDRAELSGDFCHACGYCQPCPAEIPIHMAARIMPLIRRMPSAQFLTLDWYERMHRIENCIECGKCRERCPYGINAPALLKRQLAEYEEFYQAHGTG